MTEATRHLWKILVVTNGGILRREVTGSVAIEGALFVAREDGVLELVRNAETPILLNDVQLARSAELRAGDLVQIGGVTVLVQRASPPPARPRAPSLDRAAFEARLREEAHRARRSGGRLTLLFSRSGVPEPPDAGVALEARLAPWMSAVLVLDADRPSIERWTRQTDIFDRVLGWASIPDDGLSADEVVECALARLVGDASRPLSTADDRVIVDPVMIRLRALTERLPPDASSVLLEGEPGSGKRLWAWQIHLRHGGRAESWIELDARRVQPEQLAAAIALNDAPPLSRSLLLRHLDALPPPLQDELAQHWPSHLRVFATSAALPEAQRARLRPALLEKLSAVTLSLPPLRDRPQEILPLATQAVQHARARLRRPGLSLNPEARAILQTWLWPGNVRELRNEIALAANVAESDEIRAQNLSPALVEHFASSQPGATGRDLRESLKLVEKNALLEVLARTRWNVTAAAKELGLPRRTVVYRISRLGLRRPAR